MKSAARSELFWNAPHKFESTRAVDPLGFDALREAMSNVLAPFLTGATRHAEHYIAVAVGLRWAKSRATQSVDKNIWPYFELFERGLLQYWHREPSSRPARKRYLGKRVISTICKEKRPNLDRPILVNQRGVGLLGNYIQSLRALGLVTPGRIAIDEREATRLLGEGRFKWSAAHPGSWEALDEVFSAVDLHNSWPRLGRLLFDIDGGSAGRILMHQSARAILGSPDAYSWGQLARSQTLLQSQQKIATATEPTAELEEQMRDLFAELLKGQNIHEANATTLGVATQAKRLIELRVIELVWPKRPALAQALERQLKRVASFGLSGKALLEWHLDVMRARATEPWIKNLGERSLLKLPTERPEPDFRLTNMQTLLKETRWLA